MVDLGPIRNKLLALRRRVATALALDGGARVAGALLATIAVSFLLDRVFRLEWAARAVLLVAGLAALAFVVWRYLVRRLRGLPGEDPLAIAVEARYPELNDRLISALQLAREEHPERYGMSPQLVQDAIAEAVEPVRHVRFREVLATGRVAKVATLGVIALLLLAAAATADPESAGIWFRRNVLLQNIRWPQKTYLIVDPERFPDGVAHIVRGADLVVTARSVGEIHPDRAVIFWEDSEGERGKATMKADLANHLYRHEFKEITFPLTFHLEGGDEVTDDYRIELLEAPEVDDFHLEVGFPEYAGRDPVEVDLATGDPEMLRGGYVKLRGTATKPLESVELVIGESEDDTLAATLTGPKAFELRFKPDDTVLVGVRLRDKDGLSNPSLQPRFLVRVLEDRAPRVRLQKEGIGTLVVSGAVVPYLVRANDDVKVVSGRIEVLKSAGDREAPAPHVVELPADQLGTDAVELRGQLELGPLQLSPGAFLALHAYGKDNAQPDAHEGKSDPVTLKVVTLEELFSDLLRRQQEQRQLFEALVKREKRLRDRFLDMRDSPPANPAETTIQFESQGQDQREIARRVRSIERAMGQILDEMYNNRIYDQARIHDLRTKVVRSMQNLRERVMAAHAERLDDAARRADRFQLGGADGDDVESGYTEVIRAMEAVLARMEKVEGFTEIIERMRDILGIQKKVREETERKYQKVLQEIFGPEKEKPKDESEDKDKDKDKEHK